MPKSKILPNRNFPLEVNFDLTFLPKVTEKPNQGDITYLHILKTIRTRSQKINVLLHSAIYILLYVLTKQNSEEILLIHTIA